MRPSVSSLSLYSRRAFQIFKKILRTFEVVWVATSEPSWPSSIEYLASRLATLNPEKGKKLSERFRQKPNFPF